MDSANSASLQSSSGGDDQEYDSQVPQNTNMFDPFANYFNPISSRPAPPSQPPQNPLFDMDLAKTASRFDHNSPLFNPILSDKPSSNNNSFIFGQSSYSFPSAATAVTTVTTTTAEQLSVAVQAGLPVQPPVRNPKKRSRASRRAPTTVLTTDTTNFRAMVQEFTGIPSPPFTSSTSFYPTSRSRFDIFSTPNLRSATTNTNNNINNIPLNISQPPPYLRRPFPQKIHQSQPFLCPPSSSSSLLSCLANNNNNNIALNSLSSGVANSITESSNLFSGVASSVTESSNLFSTIQQNSILTSLLQSSQKYPLGNLANSNILGSKDQELLPEMPSKNFEEYGIRSSQHGHVMMNNNSSTGTTTNIAGLPNLISSEQESSSRNNNNNNSIIQGQKVQESRGEGMVESWICSSD